MTDTAAAAGHPPGQGWWVTQDPTELTNTAVTQAKDDLRRELAGAQMLLAERILRVEAILWDLDVRTKAEMSGSINSLEALLVQRIAGLEQIMKMLDGVLKNAPGERDELRARLQNDIAIAVSGLRELHEERFAAIQQQFEERDVRGEQEKKASKEALAAALLAQKESVAQQNDANTTAATKSEASFTKQTDQLVILISTLEKSLTDRITELKERIDRGEGQGQGQVVSTGTERYEATFAQADQIARSANTRALVSSVIAGLAVLVSVISVVILVVRKLARRRAPRRPRPQSPGQRVSPWHADRLRPLRHRIRLRPEERKHVLDADRVHPAAAVHLHHGHGPVQRLLCPRLGFLRGTAAPSAHKAPMPTTLSAVWARASTSGSSAFSSGSAMTLARRLNTPEKWLRRTGSRSSARGRPRPRLP